MLSTILATITTVPFCLALNQLFQVMGLPRKRNYAGRWDILIDKSTKCLNRMFEIAARKKRNYILDQVKRENIALDSVFRRGIGAQPWPCPYCCPHELYRIKAVLTVKQLAYFIVLYGLPSSPQMRI
jgi:hypothetical protein